MPPPLGVGSVVEPWQWLRDTEGQSYFFNQETKDCVYEKPDVFMTDLEREQSTGEYVWCPHETEAFLPARVQGRDGDSLRVETISPDGRRATRTVPEKQCTPISSMVAMNDIVEDLVQLAEIY